MSLLSVIVPCYNEQEAIPYFYDAVTKTASEMKKTWKDLEFEYLFIDDGSSDDTLQTITGLRENDKQVRYISFSRNFGHQTAERLRTSEHAVVDSPLATVRHILAR